MAEQPSGTHQAQESTVGQPCASLSEGNIRRIFGRIFEMPCTEWYTSVDSRRSERFSYRYY
eukprot:1181332-Prorocentrum_minimum.AAC.3